MSGLTVGVRPSAYRVLSWVTATTLTAAVLTFGAGAPASSGTSRTWPVELGEAPMTVVATYPVVQVPENTGLLTLTLPSGYDWTPAEPSAPAPDVTWSIERDGAVVGASADPVAPDSGALAGFGTTATVGFAGLPTAPPIATGYVLRIHAAWASDAPLNAGDVVDLSVGVDVTEDEDVASDVAIDLGLTGAATESRTYDVALEGSPVGGDRLHIDAGSEADPWTWFTGPDTASPWSSVPVVSGGLGTADTDAAHPLQTFHGPFSVSTPDPTLLVVPLPDVLYAGATRITLGVRAKTAAKDGPDVKTFVNVTADYSGGTSALKVDTAPNITGRAMYGSTLQATPGAWEPVTSGDWGDSPVTFGYQWFRATTPIAGATHATYRLTPSDVGRALTVRVTAHAAGYTSQTAATRSVAIAAAPAPRAVVAPSLSGTPRAGRTLTARVGTWSPAATSYTYRWLLGGAPIRGAIKSTLVVPPGWSGRYISCRVTANVPGHLAGTRYTGVLRVA